MLKQQREPETKQSVKRNSNMSLNTFLLSRSRASRAGNFFGTRVTRLSVTKALPHGHGNAFVPFRL